MSFIPVAEARRAAPAYRGLALFAYGFRPFFLLCGVQAVLALALWLAVLGGAFDYAGPWDGARWHMHEMLFGFVGAAIAGFLLTAVPNWTGGRGYAGRPLVGLVLLWLAGRLALNPVAPLHPVPAALIDLAFFPALALTLLPSLVRSGNRRNYPFLGLLGLLSLGNLLCHLDGAGWGTWDAGILLVVDTVLLMLVMVGGRIVPSFTSSALKRAGTPVEITPRPWLERAALASLLAMLAADQADPGGFAAGAAAGLAAVVTAARLAGWQGWRTLAQPILAVLHLGYLWVPVGLALKALWLLGGFHVAAAWLHALTLGAFGTMVLAVMGRVALGHTGREVVGAPATEAAYLLLTLAVLARVAVPALPNGLYGPALVLAGLGWIGAFALFTWVYAPILAQARADGRPG